MTNGKIIKGLDWYCRFHALINQIEVGKIGNRFCCHMPPAGTHERINYENEPMNCKGVCPVQYRTYLLPDIKEADNWHYYFLYCAFSLFSFQLILRLSPSAHLKWTQVHS